MNNATKLADVTLAADVTLTASVHPTCLVAFGNLANTVQTNTLLLLAFKSYYLYGCMLQAPSYLISRCWIRRDERADKNK